MNYVCNVRASPQDGRDYHFRPGFATGAELSPTLESLLLSSTATLEAALDGVSLNHVAGGVLDGCWECWAPLSLSLLILLFPPLGSFGATAWAP